MCERDTHTELYVWFSTYTSHLELASQRPQSALSWAAHPIFVSVRFQWPDGSQVKSWVLEKCDRERKNKLVQGLVPDSFVLFVQFARPWYIFWNLTLPQADDDRFLIKMKTGGKVKEEKN
jgi:hypothetical protein